MTINNLANGLFEYQPVIPLKQNILRIHLFDKKKFHPHLMNY